MLEQRLPIIPLRDVVVFPDTITSLFIGRKKTVNALKEVEDLNMGGYILLSTQNDQSIVDDLKPSNFYHIGVVGKIIQTIRLPKDNYKVVVRADNRVKFHNIKDNGNFISARYEIILDNIVSNIPKLESTVLEVIEKFNQYSRVYKRMNLDIASAIEQHKNDLSIVLNVIASHLSCKIQTRQDILEILDLQEKADKLLEVLIGEVQSIETDQLIQNRVKQQIEKTQRDYYLNEQAKAIQKELGEGDEKDFSEIENKIKTLQLSPEAKQKAQSEFKKLKILNPSSGESGVVRTYLETLLSMPWGNVDKSEINIQHATDTLNRDHYGLEKVKERIIEYLAVLKRANKIQGPILCLVGPPGVGKTSLVKSIAESLSRQYAKFSLGGIRDEAEIRGHRRTYLGSLPGKVITILKKTKVDNPVILLDEIDKISHDYRGDPSSALLEVLDPEQNSKFSDHYLEVEYDLSNVMFVATANSLNLPRPLLDRLEIIRLSGYIEEEKFQIAKNYIIPKQFKLHNIKSKEIVIHDDTIYDLIRYYTRESGVRELERQIASLTRKALKQIIETKVKSVKVSSKDLEKYIGVRKYKIGLAEKEDVIGATTGLAYTEVGGDLLTIEAVTIPGKGEIKATGKLGDVMKESTQAAFSFVCSKLPNFGLTEDDYKTKDIHLHVPEGAIPKDGPSAGIAIMTTIVSLLTGIPVKRTIAMTGEITLRGKVLAIGGLKEKLLAALRGGIKTVLVPMENERDLSEIPKSITNGLEIIPVETAEEVLSIALTRNVFTSEKKKSPKSEISDGNDDIGSQKLKSKIKIKNVKVANGATGNRSEEGVMH